MERFLKVKMNDIYGFCLVVDFAYVFIKVYEICEDEYLFQSRVGSFRSAYFLVRSLLLYPALYLPLLC